MARLAYVTNASLDGYIEDADGNFDWGMPDDEVHQFFNDLERGNGIHLYGRRLYESMVFWETNGDGPEDPPVMHEYARIWRDSDKVVYSSTLEAVTSERTRLEHTFDPDAVRAMKAEAERDLSVGGAALGAEALRAGLVDEVHLVVWPVIVGGGKRALPDGVRLDLELIEERRFGMGVVSVRYRVVS